jgi:hypothetical protein
MFDHFCEPKFEFEPFITVSIVDYVITSAALRSLMPTLGTTACCSQFQDPSFRFISELW